MATPYRNFDITLTPEFTAYLQNIINEVWEDNPVIYPALVIKSKANNRNAATIKTAYWNGINKYIDFAMPLTSSTDITLGMIEDETEENPPTLTGHLLIQATYLSEPGDVSVNFEILAVREEDFTPEVS